VALVHYSAPPVTGGVETIVGVHARLLRARGHDMRVIAGRGEAALVPELDSRHPEVERLTAELGQGRLDQSAFEALRTAVREGLRPLLADREAIIVHNVLTMPFNLPAAAALIDLRQPLLAWTHDLAWINPRYKGYRRRGRPWNLLHEAHPGVRYVAISKVRQSEICSCLRLSRRQVPVVPDGIDELDFLQIGRPARQLLRKAGLEAARPLLLVPLRITPRKRIELALRAAALLRKRHAGLGVLVTGPLGPHSPENRAYGQRLLELRGSLRLHDVVGFCFEQATGDRHPVGDAEMAQLYRAADVVLLPSESEGFGLPILEAGLARAPVVCTDLDVLREVAGGGAWTFPARAAAQEVADAVEAALRSRNSRLRKRVQSEYTWSSVIDKLEVLLRQ
jgi:glycosyltransferase involved in cell wall biosynthesis